jgi:poly(beta-D-mannuronate) lyase
MKIKPVRASRMNCLRRYLHCAIIAPLLFAQVSAYAFSSLRSPWDAVKVEVTDAPYSCPAVPSVPRDLTMDGFYRLDDPTHSIIDPTRQAAYSHASENVKGAGLAIVAAADEFRKTGSRAAALCSLSLVRALAAQDSMAGKMSSNQASYVQGWVAGAIAIASLKVGGYGFSTAQDDASISAWLKRIADQTKSFYDAKAVGDGNRNNHFYWAGIEVAAIGVLANDQNDFDWGMKAYDNGVDRILPDGTLPLEMKRGSRALHYHLYALAPLVLLAEFGEVNGIDLYARDKGALHRLVNTSVQGLINPSLFERTTGVKQEVSAHPSGDEMGWAPPYLRRFPDTALRAFVANASSLSVYYLGGLPPP